MTIYDQLLEALKDEKSLLIAEAQYTSVIASLDKEMAKLAKAELAYKDELKELEKMEKLSLKSVFYKVLGSEETQLEKERQEYLDASLHYNEIKSAIDLLRFEKDVLEKKLAILPATKERVITLKNQREAKLLKENSAHAKALRSIIIELEELEVYKQELKEAYEATDKLLQLFHSLVESLTKARNWGRWDMGSKQGRYYTRMKYQEMDRARNIVYHIKRQADILRKELSDIGVNEQIADFEIYAGDSFMGIFLNNIITDWIVQKKISDSLKLSQTEQRKVISISNYIEKEYNKITADRQALLKKRDDILVS